MSEQAGQETGTAVGPQWGRWLLAGLVILLLIWLGLQLSGSRPLKPFRETAVPGDINLNGQPLLVDFDGLNDNPAEFADKRIRVSGSYLRLEPPDCALFSGPRIEWGLVAEGLQLNALGFEAVVLPIVPANTLMTLEGIWRRYPGPAGCGKEPPSGLWYLEVEQIVQPNPLMAGTATTGAVQLMMPTPLPGTPTPIPTGLLPPAIGTPIPNVTIVSTIVVSTPLGSPTAPSTAVFLTPTTTLSPDVTGTITITPSNTPTAASTPSPGSSTTPTPSNTPASGTSVPTPTNPSLVTATPGSGYPGPSTPSPVPYP